MFNSDFRCVETKRAAGLVRPFTLMFSSFPQQVFVYGFSYRKRRLLGKLLSGIRIRLTLNIDLTPPNAVIVVWGAKEISQNLGQREVIRVEDGFYRSVGLGSDFVNPSSLVFDRSGIYFDPRTPSDLESILNSQAFNQDDLARAKQIRDFIIQNQLTKYNLEAPKHRHERLYPSKVIFVPGQVEDDASIIYGGGEVRTNLGLLEAVRLANPNAYLFYKPHPDVQALNRKGRMSKKAVLQYADAVEYERSVIDCIDGADEVHTMTSLVGFDALMRDKKVVTYGQPFYAGWGLTQDVFASGEAFLRRGRKLSLDELVAGALIHYPIYWDWESETLTTCEAALIKLAKARNELIASGRLASLKEGFIRRQLRKVIMLLKALT